VDYYQSYAEKAHILGEVNAFLAQVARLSVYYQYLDPESTPRTVMTWLVNAVVEIFMAILLLQHALKRRYSASQMVGGADNLGYFGWPLSRPDGDLLSA